MDAVTIPSLRGRHVIDPTTANSSAGDLLIRCVLKWRGCRSHVVSVADPPTTQPAGSWLQIPVAQCPTPHELLDSGRGSLKLDRVGDQGGPNAAVPQRLGKR